MINHGVYISATQHLNKALYNVRVPAYAVSKANREVPQEETEVYYTQGVKVTSTVTNPFPVIPSSFYQYSSPESRLTTGLTIPQIMRMVEDKIDCTLVETDEVIDIFCILDDYLREVRENVFNKESDFVSFVKRVLVFRKEMYFHFQWAVQKNPEWRKFFDRKYSSPYGKGLRALMGMSSKDEFNGIAQLATPPYTLEEIEALYAVERKKTEKSTENRLTLSDYIGGNQGVVGGKDGFSKEEIEGADLISRYL